MSLWKAAILGLYLIATGDFAGALDPEKRITQYIHDAWDKEDGLPQMSARHLVQTNDGYLWIGTSGGLARFDGVRFKTYGPDNEREFKSGWIQKLCKDRDGALWIGTQDRNLVRYKDGKFQDFAARFGINDEVRSVETSKFDFDSFDGAHRRLQFGCGCCNVIHFFGNCTPG